MKAKKYGTMAEQARFEIDYNQPFMLSKKQFNRCRNCSNAAKNSNGRLRCRLISYAVAPGGCCSSHKPADKGES